MTFKKVWSKVHAKLKKTMKNYLGKIEGSPLNEDTFIDEKKRVFSKIIESNPKWGDSNRMAYFYMISRYLDLKNPKDKYVKIYAQKGYDLQQKIEKETGQNKLDGKEVDSYRDYDYFRKILYNIPDEKDTLKSNYERLLLSVMILQPPLRTSFYRTATFINSIKDNNKKDNFIHINKRGKKSVTFIVNKDKASNYKVYKKNPALSLIKVESQELVDFIIDSLTRYPRKYFFENPSTKKSLDDNALLRKLRDITKIKKVNFQMMRSIYITWHHKNNPKYEDKKQLAFKMRHSVDTATKNYNKVLDDSKDEPDEDSEEESKDEDKPKKAKKTKVKEAPVNVELKTENDEVKKENVELKKELHDVKVHCHDAFKPTDKLYVKRRADILYRYNKKNVKPKEITMNKYNIKYDDANKIYE